jgi:RNA polymerase sigma-70 factor (ECF subfamily)
MLLDRETEFEALYRAHYLRVYHYILRRIGEPETAQELTGDVFRIAWQKFDDQDDAGLPWLCAVAHNLLGNEYRGRKRRRELMVKLKDLALVGAGGQEAAADGSPRAQGSASDLVIETLGRLAERHREVLILVYWDNFTTAELARCLGCSEGAAGVRLHRAKKAFTGALPKNVRSAGS